MPTRENVPAPEGHLCNEAWHDDATARHVLGYVDSAADAFRNMVNELRQADVAAAVLTVLRDAVMRTDGTFRHASDCRSPQRLCPGCLFEET